VKARYGLFGAGLLCAGLSGLFGWWACLMFSLPGADYLDSFWAGAYLWLCVQLGLTARRGFNLALDPGLR
jgi:hypothetical protein